MTAPLLSKVNILLKHPSLRSITVLMSGTVTGQALIALSSPVLTRVYTPDEMGALNIFTSISSVVIGFAALRFNEALQVPRDQEEARSLTHISLASVLLVATLSAIVALVFRDQIANLFSTPELRGYILLLPVVIITAGMFEVMNSWSVRVKAFSLIAKARVRQSFAIVAAQVAFGVAGFGGWGLVSGDSFGRFVGASGQLRHFRASESEEPVQRDYIGLIKRYKRFPLYSVPPALMNSAAINLPTFYLAAQHGPGVVGFYALGQRVLGLPLNVIANAVSQVFLSQAAELYWHSVDRLAARTRTVWLILMVLGLAIVLPIALFGPWAFGVIFGERWLEAGVYVRALAPMLWAQFSFSPLSAVLVVLERQDLHALRETLRVILLGGALAVMTAIEITEPLKIVQVFSIFGAFSYILGGLLVWYALRKAKQGAQNNA